MTDRKGRVFLEFTAMMAGMTVFLQRFRGDSTLLPGNLRVEQVVALAILGLAFLLLEIRASGETRELGKNTLSPEGDDRIER